MNILYYCVLDQTTMTQWQNVHFIDELLHYGIEIKVLNLADFSSIETANEALLKRIRSEDFALFMTGHNENSLYLETLAEIRAKGIPTLLVCWDNGTIPYEHKMISSHFDLVWLTSPLTVDMFQRWGAKTLFQTAGANPFFFHYEPQNEILQTTFVGRPYGSRANTINALLSNGIPVSMYCGGRFSSDSAPCTILSRQSRFQTVKKFLSFSVGRRILLARTCQFIRRDFELDTENPLFQANPSVSFEEMPRIYSTYALSLASTAARNTGILKHPVDLVNLRSFEIPMCGGVQFCRYTEELGNYFKEDKEIIFYHSNEEMVDKARFYLSPERESIRNAIRVAARRRAENEHTWYLRFKRVFDVLGIKTTEQK